MDTRIWIGALVGALGTLVIVGGVVVVRAATSGPMGMMGGGMMGGMGMMGDMDEMHGDCKRMMEEHEEAEAEDAASGNETATHLSSMGDGASPLPFSRR